MSAKEKIEGYLLNLELTYEEVDDNTWVISDEEKGIENFVVVLEDPIVIFRIKVMEVPDSRKQEFYEALLRLNAEDMIHGAYALEDSSVILMNTLLNETMDLEEFQATLEAIGLALAQHYQVLSKYRQIRKQEA